MTQTEVLQQFKQLDRSSPNFPDQLTNLLYKQEYKESIPNLQNEEVIWLVNYLDDVLESLQANPSSSAFRRCLRELGRICGVRQWLPESYILETSLSILSRYPVASGGSGDVYEGSLNDSKVCVKRLRIYAGEDSPGAKKTFHREAVMWKRLSHPNIVPLLGITLKPLQLISAWMPGGELKEYISRYPNTDRFRLLFGIADGLNYLHCRNIVHGDLKGPNILVDDTGYPRITDFGLAMVAQNQDSIRSAQGEHGHTARWTAPEILSGEGTYSKEADVFSFAMVMVEAFTGQVPFHPHLPPAAMLAILDKKRPPRPTHPQLTIQLWKLMGTCWDPDPLRRPEISAVIKTFRSSNPSFSIDRASDVSTPYTLPESTESDTTESPDSPKIGPWSSPERGGSGAVKSYLPNQSETPGSGVSNQGPTQAATKNATPNGNTSHRSEGQDLSILTGMNPPRRGTDQSVQTPLPVDPPQSNFDHQRNIVHPHPRNNRPHSYLPTGPGNSSTLKEDVSGPPVDCSNSRSSPHKKSMGETATTRQRPIPGGNLGASRSVPTLFEPYRAGNNHNSKSRNPSLHGSRNRSGNFSRSQPDLQDSARDRPRLGLGKSNPVKNPSMIHLSGSNENTNPSGHKLQAETEPRNQSQCALLPGTKTSHSGPMYGKPRDPSGRGELAKLQPNGMPPTPGASEDTQNQHACRDPSRKTSEKGSKESSGVPAPRKDRGVWDRIMGILCCASDKNMSH